MNEIVCKNCNSYNIKKIEYGKPQNFMKYQKNKPIFKVESVYICEDCGFKFEIKDEE